MNPIDLHKKTGSIQQLCYIRKVRYEGDAADQQAAYLVENGKLSYIVSASLGMDLADGSLAVVSPYGVVEATVDTGPLSALGAFARAPWRTDSAADPQAAGAALIAAGTTGGEVLLIGRQDGILARLRARGIAFGNDPRDQTNGRTDHPFGGRGLFFLDPNGHLFEVMTRVHPR